MAQRYTDPSIMSSTVFRLDKGTRFSSSPGSTRMHVHVFAPEEKQSFGLSQMFPCARHMASVVGNYPFAEGCRGHKDEITKAWREHLSR